MNSKNQILLLLRSEKTGGGGKWSLPGGELEYGENPIDGIKREIKEETELDVTDIQLYSVRSRINNDKDFVVNIGYQCHAISETVTLNWEHDDFRWLTQEEALQLELTDDGRFFVEQYLS